MRIKPCPWCGWMCRSIQLSDEQHRGYYIFCSHCGYKSPVKRFIFSAKHAWNRAYKDLYGNKKRRHIFGREY